MIEIVIGASVGIEMIEIDEITEIIVVIWEEIGTWAEIVEMSEKEIGEVTTTTWIEVNHHPAPITAWEGVADEDVAQTSINPHG